ncbi:hypothetical protein KY325_04025, partial [Candidatus Woesearchaeota archaeon]|nr:hypothetical protein [Candidatus Woesearchaeota archaeon]
EIGRCPECGHQNFFVSETRGEVICKKCAAVVESNMIDFGQEWTSFEDDGQGRMSRVGAAFDPRVANNLRTKVGNQADLNRLKGNKRFQMRRLSQKNNWSSSALETNFNNALSSLRVMASALKVPERVEKEAARIYREAAERGLTRARSSETIVMASLYLSCRVNDIPKTLKEFNETFNVDKKIIGKAYKLVARELNIKLIPSSSLDFLSRFASSLNLTAKVQSKAAEFVQKAEKMELVSGCNPTSTAAASLYISALINKEKRTQKQVSDISGISEVTLRAKVKELTEKLKIKNKSVLKK